MPLSLPDPIAAYFLADTNNAQAVAACFTTDAVVIDENQRHQGREAIARWKAEASDRYVAEPRTIEGNGEQRIVTARLTGEFPGSPVDLRYAFTLVQGEIAKLEITT